MRREGNEVACGEHESSLRPRQAAIGQRSSSHIMKNFLTTWLPLVLIAFIGMTGDAAPAQTTPPNVLLILADDMGVGDIAAFNGGRNRTPNLDKLISEGLWFERAYSGSCVCAPARAALLTGRYPHRTGVVSLTLSTEPELTRLKRDETTLADVFAANGYRTGLIGKWHTGLGDGYGPVARGFQEVSVFHGSDNGGYNRYILHTDDRMEEKPKPQERYLTDELNARAIAFVRRHADKPFFLHLAHYAPHRPLEAPAEAVASYLKAGFDKDTATVYAMIEIMDRGIGELLRELDTPGFQSRPARHEIHRERRRHSRALRDEPPGRNPTRQNAAPGPLHRCAADAGGLLQPQASAETAAGREQYRAVAHWQIRPRRRHAFLAVEPRRAELHTQRRHARRPVEAGEAVCNEEQDRGQFRRAA
jgi:hypothetical protein